MTPAVVFALFSTAALGALFFYPLGELFAEGLRTSVDWRDPFFWRVLRFTYGQAFLSATLSGVVGIAGALIYSENRFPGRALLWKLGLLPFSFPTILAALGFVGFWGPVFGLPAILAVHVFFNFPLFLKMVGTALVESDRATEMAALSLGASRTRTFFAVTLPKIAPAIRSAFVLSFLYCAASFLVVLLLGGGPRFTTLEVAIYGAVKVDFNPALAVRLALVQMGIALCVYFIFLRSPRDVRFAYSKDPLPLYRAPLALGVAYAILMAMLVGAPIGSLAFGARHVDLGELARASLTSLELALAVAATSLALAFPLAYLERHGARSMAFVGGLPLSVSSLVLTLALMLAYPERIDLLRGTLLGAVIVQSLLALPLVYRPLRDAFFRIPDPLLLVGRSLGAGPWRLLAEVELPLVRRSAALAATFAAALSLGEVGSLLVFLSADRNPLPLWVYRLMGQYQFDEAYGVGCALLLFSGGLYFVGARWER